MVLTDLREPATAGAASQQVREEIDRAAGALRANTDVIMRQDMPDSKRRTKAALRGGAGGG